MHALHIAPPTLFAIQDLDALIRIHLDPEEDDYHVDALPGHDPQRLAELFAAAPSMWGLEPLDPEESMPDLLEDGTLRIWLVEC